MPCPTARSPLLTPDVRISRIRRSQIPLPQACARSWFLLGLLAQLVSQKREILRHLRIARSRIVIQAVLPSSYTRTYLAGSLGSTGITPLPRYYEPRRLPARAARTVMSSRPALGARPTPPGLPGSSVDPSPRAVPNHPGESRACVYPLLPRGCQASPSLAGWPLSLRFNEAEAGSLDYGSRLRRPRLRTRITPESARLAFW